MGSVQFQAAGSFPSSSPGTRWFLHECELLPISGSLSVLLPWNSGSLVSPACQWRLTFNFTSSFASHPDMWGCPDVLLIGTQSLCVSTNRPREVAFTDPLIRHAEQLSGGLSYALLQQSRTECPWVRPTANLGDYAHRGQKLASLALKD